MNFRLLRYFLAVASTLSFSRAAENLHISQSTLSQQIQQLEDYYGVRLFNRMGRSISLTPAGIELQDAASRMLVEEEQLQRRLKAVDDGAKITTYPLRIFFDAHMTQGQHLISCIIETILKLQTQLKDSIDFHPLFSSSDLDDPSIDLNSILSDSQVDLWIIGAESDMKHSNVRFEVLFRDRYSLLISKRHPLYRDDLTLEDIPFILNNTILFMVQNRSKHLRAVLDHLPGNEEVSPSIRFERSADVISVYVAMGVGVSIVPEDNQNRSMSMDCKSISIPNTFFYTLVGRRPDDDNPVIPMVINELMSIV